MNFDWLNPCPIYFLNSWKKKRGKKSKPKQNIKTASLLFPSHQLFHLGDNKRARQLLDDDRHERCTICLLMSLCVSPHFCLLHLHFPFFLKRSLLLRYCVASLHFSSRPWSCRSRWVHFKVSLAESPATSKFCFVFGKFSLQTSHPLATSQVLIAVNLAGSAALPEVNRLTLRCICPVFGPGSESTVSWAEES